MSERMLLINADDFGIYAAANDAIVETLDRGLVGSCSLMVPAPGAGEAVQILTDRPELAFGIHLSLVTDFPTQRREPLTGGRSLVDAHGRLFTSDTKDRSSRRRGSTRSQRSSEPRSSWYSRRG